MESFKEIRENLAEDITDWRESVYTKDKSLSNFKALVYAYGVLSGVHKNEMDMDIIDRIEKLETKVYGEDYVERETSYRS